MTHKEVITKLRTTKSESKRELLDTAADMIETLLAQRNALAYRLGVIDGNKHREDLSDGALD